MKIFDCFIFFNELELLELRFEELYDTVDFFVLVEATRTHAGNEKPLFFNENKERYKKWSDKIIHVIVDDMPIPKPIECPLRPARAHLDHSCMWTAENFQRNAISRGLEGIAEKGDRIIVSDADEIPSPSGIKQALLFNRKVNLKQELFYYYVNVRFFRNWGGSAIGLYGSFGTPHDLRCYTMRHGMGDIVGGGWHYSYLIGNNPERALYKAKNIADGPISTGKTTKEVIVDRLDNLVDLYGRRGRSHEMSVVDIDATKPASMDSFIKKYPYLFYKKK
jgi:beta-1,4-mannosyl-glycoprotein beta-1,4-N-acetylglucosaminyltransferase